jgi:hypothetical protein
VASFGQSLSSADVTRVQLTVSASDFSPPLSTDLVKADGQWRGLIGSIPAGSNRTFLAQAFGADGTVLFEGRATGVAITAGKTTVVSITLQPVTAPPPSGNLAPVIDALVASSSTVEPGGTITLQATVHDPNPGDLITSSWTATAGAFGPAAGNSITWTAPATTGMVTLRLTVMDPHGAATSMDLTLSVQTGTGSADVTIRINTWPHVASLSVAPSPVVVGQAATVRVSAGDAEGDSLSYQWSASGCTGSWTGATTSEARFTPDALPTGDACSCQLSVKVSDGNGGQVSRSLPLCVQTTTEFPQPPVVTSTFQSATTVPGGTSVTLRVKGMDPKGGALSFSWSANVGTLGTPTNGSDQSEVVWTAPACLPPGTSPSIQVTLGNALSLTTTATFTVSGLLECGPSGPRLSPWTFLGGLAVKRWRHAAVLLPSGKVLLAGGWSASQSAEVYDPVSNTSALTGSMEGNFYEDSTLTLLPNGKVLLLGRSIQYHAELYDPVTETWSLADQGPGYVDIEGHTATLLKSGKVLVAGGGSSTVTRLYDSASNTWLSTGSLATPRTGHTATLLPSGKVLVTGGGASGSTSIASAELYDPVAGTWSPTGSMATPRKDHTATLLSSGKVLVTGGSYGSTALASAELYDPVTGTWSPTGSMATPRKDHKTELLPSGKVLVMGGSNSGTYLVSAELYDPATGTWMAAESMRYKRVSHMATLLPSGKVLVSGGENEAGGSNASSTIEVYDPVTEHWTATSSASSLTGPSALLPSGKVLVLRIGGAATFDPVTMIWTPISGSSWYNVSVTPLLSGSLLLASDSRMEVFDPSTNSWATRSTPPQTLSRGHTATLLASGKVLMVGGSSSAAQVYEPPTDTWSTTGPMSTARYNHSATRLSSGKVLVAGGRNSTGLTATAELYDPATETWTATAAMATPRENHAAALLPSGEVLVVGGNSPFTAELYNPATATWTTLPPMPSTPSGSIATATLLPSGKVLVTSYRESWLFEPTTHTWTSTGNMEGESKQTAQLLGSGEVLVIRDNGLVPALYTP